ncbi:hypothetical protein F4780DRAFT_533941 [Xylariomycetidae sp. FL0641]|nr:hypothetical protein F4780DRAFT_533941 [Xylariomycetidae sp. FL0641]
MPRSDSTASASTQYTQYTQYTQSSDSTAASYYSPSEAPSAAAEWDDSTVGTDVLWCEFLGYTACDATFRLDDVQSWIDHIIDGHLSNKLPRRVQCWFCDDYKFDAGKGDRRSNFEARLWHIYNHVFSEHKGAACMRLDFHMNDHIEKHNLASRAATHGVRRLCTEAPVIDDMVPLGTVPEGQAYQAERANQVLIDGEKDERRRRKQHGHSSRSSHSHGSKHHGNHRKH